METRTPKISVLMSVKNGMPYIKETVPSVLGQTFTDFEFVIVDNFSTDGTREYLQQLTTITGRVQLLLNERDLGHSGALNRGLEACRAEWIARIDADDVALHQRLKRQLAFVEANPDVAVTCCLAYYINEHGERKGKTFLPLTSVNEFRDYMARNEAIGLLHPGVLMRKSAILEVGGYRERFGAANDIDLWGRIAERNHVILVQPEYLMEYRIHSGAISSRKYLEARLKYEWVRVCMLARRSGRPEPDWEAFLKEWSSAGPFRRLNRSRKTLAKMYYRRGGESFITGHRAKGIASFLLSALLQPSYALKRVIGQLLFKKPEYTDHDSVPAGDPAAKQAPVSVTFVIPCHNAGPFIRQAIESCLQQTRPPEGVVVVDDASTDGSADILDEFARAGRIRLLRNPTRRGRAESVNHAFDTVKTKYIALLDADDISLPHRLERQTIFMEAHPAVGCSGSFVHYINEKGRRIASGVLDLLTESRLRHYLESEEAFGLYVPGVMLRSEILKNPTLRFRGQFWPAGDIDLWNRIAEAGWQVLAQPEFLAQYRIHPNSTVTKDTRYTRMQYDWVRACLRARRRGQSEPDFKQFQAYLAALPWRIRFNRWRKTEAKVAYRTAGFAYCQKRYPRIAAYLIKAFCLQPTWVSRRLVDQMFKL